MRFYADLHVHSKYSRATSGDCDLPHLAYWARRKGITVIGTGDFTHPAWRAELREHLVPAEPGLYRLRDDLDRAVGDRLEAPCRGETRFMLSVEISTIYKKGDRTRKVHHLIYAPDFEAADRLVGTLSKIGNLQADGRPILGLDSRHLLEAVLESDAGSYLVPAHIWTPWFSVLGSKAGFDAVEDCYGDLSSHIFALETGLSSDPAMNWRLSAIDRYRLVSSSDAHSPAKLGREATVFDTPLDYFAIRRALETGEGFCGTAEFFPEEGKYHLDGHRKCNVAFLPEETRACGDRCPTCGQGLTVGVLHRVEDLADREEGARPEGAQGFRNLVPLPEVLAELHGVGPASRAVQRSYDGLLSRLGPELFILEDAPLEAIERAGTALLAEAVSRMRAGRVIRQAGYDGEYGVIRLFEAEELRRRVLGGVLFEQLDGEPLAGAGAGAGAKGETARAQEAQGKGNAGAGAGAGARGSQGGGEAGRSEFMIFHSRLPASSPPCSNPSPPKADAGAETGAGAGAETGAGADAGAVSILAGFDADQRAAAGSTGGALLIVAGPGTGKTRTLTHRIAHLIMDEGAEPEACLAITFTRRAADELRERLRALLGDQGERVPTMTFHALGLSILREHAGDRRARGLAGERERSEILERALGLPARRAARLLADISRLKRICPRRVDAGRLAPGALPPRGELDRAWQAYEEALDARGRWDFDDLVGTAVELLETRPEVLAAVRARYRWVSIDEYQDVDERQYRMVRAIVPPGGDVCAIGDPDQAIYGFRGADVGFFFRFQEDFPGARVVRLRRNYRSTRPIVEAALQVVGPSPTLGVRELIPVASRGGLPVALREAPTERAEAELVVHQIERGIGGSTFFSMDSGRVASPQGGSDLGFSDFAVLYRTEAQAEALREALARSGMPFQQRSHRRVADRAAAELIAAELLAAPSPWPLAERLKEAAARVREVVARPPGEGGAGGMEGEAPVGEADVDGALELLLQLAERAGGDVDRFQIELATGTEVDTWDPRADRISLLTLHAAKGLEFRVVFLVGCEDGLLPLRFSRDEQGDTNEERRLFYVGMTRARERLVLSRARERARHGRVVQAEISPFVGAIEERLLERGEPTERKAPDPARRQMKLF